MHFLGLSLSGGKKTKTCLTVIEYFPSEQKVFLRYLYDKIGKSKTKSSDEELIAMIDNIGKGAKSLSVDVPVQLPICSRCRLKCPGVAKCRQKEVQWMRDKYIRLNEKSRPKKVVTPYTERCQDFFLTYELDEKFSPGHGLGANLAPLAARMQFLEKQLTVPVKEVFPRASLWRVGRSLGISKSALRFHKHAIDGDQARARILDELIRQDIAFLYVQDVRMMIENSWAFDSFICALTGLLDHMKQCEPRPKGYPKSAKWVSVPRKEIDWV